MAAPIIWINAFPGTGKLTVATSLATRHSPILVIDNHQLIDPVAAIYSRDHPNYQAERKREREKAFSKYVSDPSWAEHTIVFTDFQSTNQLGRSVAHEYRVAAEKAGRPFVPVYLTCDIESNIERATSHERLQGQTTKLTDPKFIRDLRNTYELFQFEQGGFKPCIIDTTEMMPTGASKKILEYCRSIGVLKPM